MKTIKKYPSKEILDSLFTYVNGKIYWKNRRGNKEAGRPDNKGYYRVCVNGEEFKRSRIIYILHFSIIPENMLIDHINGVKGDDRIENLRVSTNSQNKNNTRARADSKSGIKGVSWNSERKRWVAQITYGGKINYLGLFKKKKDAATAYQVAAKEHHGEFAKF